MTSRAALPPATSLVGLAIELLLGGLFVGRVTAQGEQSLCRELISFGEYLTSLEIPLLCSFGPSPGLLALQRAIEARGSLHRIDHTLLAYDRFHTVSFPRPDWKHARAKIVKRRNTGLRHLDTTDHRETRAKTRTQIRLPGNVNLISPRRWVGVVRSRFASFRGFGGEFFASLFAVCGVVRGRFAGVTSARRGGHCATGVH